MEYMPYLGQPQYGANPWENVTNQSLGYYNQANTTASTQIPNLQNSIYNTQNQMQAYGGSSAYPTFPNSSGIGSQNPSSGVSPMPVDNSLMAANPQSQQQAQPVSGSRGFNPWSLTGEALSR